MDATQRDAGPTPAGVEGREIQPLSVKDVSERIGLGRGLSTIKLNHGFWEQLVEFEDKLGAGGETTLADVDETLIAAAQRQGSPWPATLLRALLAIMRSAAAAPGLMVLASPLGWRGGREIEGTPVVGLDRVNAAIERYIPADVGVFDGLVWKNAIEDHSFVSFVEELRAHPVLIAAPEYVRSFAAHAGLNDAAFVPVHPTHAAFEVSEILERIAAAVEAFERPPVTLIESGGVASSWLCAKLGQRFPGSVNLCLGQALNLFAVEELRATHWFYVRRERILATAQAIDPAADRLWEAASGAASSVGAFNRPCSVSGRDLALGRLASQAVAEPAEGHRPIPFIERKEIDHELASELLGLSERAGRFANFGPVSRLFEDAVHELLGLGPNKRVIACKSATDGLHALVGLHEYKRQRPLRWVVSAFGFYSSAIGPLADAIVIDCDERGMLDFERLEGLPGDAWDGLILTNPFASATDIDRYTEICLRQGKPVILDSAAALFSAIRAHADPSPDEAISFHHTKPWGVGEGGCILVDEGDAEVARSLLNFGVGLDRERARRHARNSKYSDYDSALVLARLMSLPRWADLYRLQARRVGSIAARAGLEPLAPTPDGVIVGSLPLLAPAQIGNRQLDNPHLALRKYYRPLADAAPRAADIYGRIINVPCHPGVAECPTATLEELAVRLCDGG